MPMNLRRGHGKPCAYCQRIMEDRGSGSGLACTRDHVKPKSLGGKAVILACRLCNTIKGDMEMEDWRAFMECYPRWWENKLFAHLGNQPERPMKQLQPRYREWQNQEREQRRRDAHALAIIPYHESMMIMRHGKDYWRAWKLRDEPPCECCQRRPHGEVRYTADGFPIVPVHRPGQSTPEKT